MGATDLTVKVGADLTGYKTTLAAMPGIAKGIGVAVAAAFAAATAAILGAAKVGGEFEQTLTETATVAQAFGKDLKALEDKARELGRTTAFTATEAAKGMYDLASAGMTTAEIVDSIEHAMKLAGATGSEMTQATNILSSSIRTFGIEASDSRRITDTFAAGITNSKLTMESLTEAMKHGGLTGAALKWSIEETVAAVAQFVNVGMQGEMAGTYLRMSMNQLVKQTDDMTNALHQMGLKYEDINPETHNFGEILMTLGKNSMTTTQALDIFGARANLAMKRLSEAAVQGEIDYDGLLKKLIKAQEGAGLTVEMYERMMGTFQGRWVILKSVISDLFITFFDTFKGSGKLAFEEITKSVEDFAQHIRDNGPEITRFFEDLAAVVTAAAKTMMFFVENTGLLIIKIHELKEQTVEGVKKTADAFEESIKYYPTFVENLIMAWYELADEIQKKDIGTFLKEQFLESNRGITKQIELTKEADAALRHTLPTYYKTTDTIKAMGEAVDDTYTDWEKVSKKTTKSVVEDSNDFLKGLIANTKELDKLDEISEKVFSDMDRHWEQLSDQQKREIRDLDEFLEAWQRDFELMSENVHTLGKAVDDFANGAKAAFYKAEKSFLTFAQAGEKMMEKFIESARTMMGDVFYDVMTGQFDDISDAFSNFFDSILRGFTSMLGEMVANDIIKGGLQNALGVGLAGAIGYVGVSAMGGSQSMAGMAATGAMMGYQYTGNPYGAIVGGVVGLIAGAAMGGGGGGDKEPRYSTQSDYVQALRPVVDVNSMTFDFKKVAPEFVGLDDTFTNQIAAAQNEATTKIASSLEDALNSVPVEMRKQIINSGAYSNQALSGLGYGIYSAEDMKAGHYQRFVEDKVKLFAENAQEYLNEIAKTMGQGSWEALEKEMLKFETAAQISSNLIADAFTSAFDTGEYTFDAFKENLYDAIFNTVKEGMVNALLQSEAFRAALNPFFKQFQDVIERSTVGGLVRPESLAYWSAQLDVNGLLANIEALRPLLDVMASTINNVGDRIYGRASGGPVRSGVPYIVGENEPELFVPDTNGYINPSLNGGSGRGGSVVFINQGVLTEAEFFTNSMRKYQDYRQGDTLQTVNISTQGLRIG